MSAPLTAWLTEADIDFYAGEFARTGFPRRSELVSQHRSQLGTASPFAGSKVAVPALYIAGDRDVVLSFPGVRELVTNLKVYVPELRQTIILPGCGHWTQQERHEAVNAAMLSFLQSL